MNATVIDTLRFADRLKAAGFEAPHAEGMARALGDELAERMLTKSDLDEALRPIYARFDAIDAQFDAIDARFVGIDARFVGIDGKFVGINGKFVGIDGKFEAIDKKFEAIDARFDAIDVRFDAIDAKFVAIDARFDAIDAKFVAIDARFDAMDTKIDSLYRELSGKFNILVGVVALGFTLLVGLGGYNAVSPRFAQPIMQAPQMQQEAIELPGTPPSQPLAEG